MKKPITLIVYTKKIVDKVHDKKFDKYLCKYGNKTLDLNFSHACEDTLKFDMKENKLHFPVKLELNPEGYFINKKEYETKTGEKKTKAIMVVMEYEDFSQYEFEDRDIDEILSEIYCAEMVEKSE